ncbi:DUF342 domain-containing protein [Paenibacillus sp. 1001270B_150601_E10]|uniref:DUF342 domain-containing protein n=1 Tax=Paenibacillus sp. 1001270B_150601_E10 TaxID=2787079 RepID=UPI00189C68D6|nr:FapA family protein [Paenibacillus sp. 1001270B_150601_E10]
MSTTMMLEQYLEVSLSEDKMTAYLHINDVDQNVQFTEDQLEQFLKSSQVQYGLKQEVLREIARRPLLYMKEPVVVATGQQPVDGVDGKIEVLMSLAGGTRPLEQEDGSVDLKEIQQLNNVTRGQRIAVRTPAAPARPGTNVRGEAVKGRDGKEARFKLGKNVVTDGEAVAAYAAIDGLIVKTEGDKLNVFPVYEVNGDVDYRTGNIDFVGTVVVRGNVLTGFRIKAAGDIRVIGGVEGAQMEAQGSIEITGGVIAAHKGSIQAGQQIKCSFVQEGNLIAGTDVIVSQSIMHSNVRASKQVICNGTKGLIVGGKIQAGERVVARTIGNNTSTATTIEVGVLPELRNELTELRQQFRVANDNLDKTEKALNLLDKLAAAGELSEDKMQMRHKLNLTKKSIVQEQTDIRERIFELEKTLEDSNDARVDVHQLVYGGSKMVIGRYTRYVKDVNKHVSFRFIDGEIAMVSL